MKELVIKGEGSIHISVTVDAAPFFKEEIESKFYEIRDTEKYKHFVGFDSPLSNPDQNNAYYKSCRDYCEYDNGERELEKIGYDIEAFRGLIYNDFFTPMYEVKNNSLIKLLKNEKKKIKEHFIGDSSMYYYIHSSIIDKLVGIIDGCKIWVKLSNGGIAYMILEKKIKNKTGETSIKEYYTSTQTIMASPFLDKENEIKKKVVPGQIFDAGSDKLLNEIIDLRSRKTEQVFTSYLWALATYSIHFFLEKSKMGKWISEEVLVLSETKDENYLKLPYEVKYGHTLFTKDSPPVRNYLIAYHLPSDIIGKENGKEVTFLKEYFECLEDINKCKDVDNETKQQHKDQLRNFGSLLLSLLEGSFVKENGVIALPKTISRKAEKISKLDLSSWKGELCLLESEGVVICNPKINIYVGGKELAYDDYWKCIIKGLSFLTGGKTYVQVIHRMLIECTKQYRNVRVEKNLKRKEEDQEINNIECKISIISSLLSKSRIALSPSMIARAEYARGKFERFIQVTGLENLLKTLEISFSELNGAVKHFADTRRQRSLNTLTKISVAFATIMVILTMLLLAIEIWNIFRP